jgi:hypothetical protein
MKNMNVDDLAPPTLSYEQVQAILKFMANVQLVGADAPLFLDCVGALQRVATSMSPPRVAKNGAVKVSAKEAP